jgi:hypothetical protein
MSTVAKSRRLGQGGEPVVDEFERPCSGPADFLVESFLLPQLPVQPEETELDPIRTLPIPATGLLFPFYEKSILQALRLARLVSDDEDHQFIRQRPSPLKP